MNREIHETVGETISDIANLAQTIKISGEHDSVLKHYEKLNRKRLDVVLKDKLFESILQAVTGSTVYIGTAVMMLVIAKSMMRGEFPIGDFSMFVHDAELYVMDDSSSAIDIETEKEFWNRFEKNITKKKFACIIASNKKYVLERADKVIFLKNGNVVGFGKADELSTHCEEFARIYMR